MTIRILIIITLILYTGLVSATDNDELLAAQKLLESGKINEASLLYEEYANKGSVEAAYVLATIYESEDSVLSEENKTVKAVKWYKIAANRNHLKAQYRVGSLYYAGSWRGQVDQDLNQALGWFEIAAIKGHIKAQFKLGNLFCWFNETIKGYAWFTVVIKQGDESAKKERARICRNLTPEMLKKANRLAKQYLKDFSTTKTL